MKNKRSDGKCVSFERGGSTSQAYWTFTFSEKELKGRIGHDWETKRVVFAIDGLNHLPACSVQNAHAKAKKDTAVAEHIGLSVFHMDTKKTDIGCPSATTKKTCKCLVMLSPFFHVCDLSAPGNRSLTRDLNLVANENGGDWGITYSFCRHRFAAVSSVQAKATGICFAPHQVSLMHHFAQQSPSTPRNTSTHTHNHPGKGHSKLHMSNSWFLWLLFFFCP